jgi:hypothetical protein
MCQSIAAAVWGGYTKDVIARRPLDEFRRPLGGRLTGERVNVGQSRIV